MATREGGESGIRLVGPGVDMRKDVQDSFPQSAALRAVRQMIEDEYAMVTTEDLVIDVEWDGEDAGA